MKTKNSAITSIKVSDNQYIVKATGSFHEDIYVCITQVPIGKNKGMWVGICSNGNNIPAINLLDTAKEIATLYLIDLIDSL